MHALLDLFLEAVIEIVVHLLRQLFVIERAQIEFAFVSHEFPLRGFGRYVTARVASDKGYSPSRWRRQGDRNRLAAARCRCYVVVLSREQDSRMRSSPFPIEDIRAQFPALAATDEGKRRIYFDNPAGTQVPQRVIERTVEALTVKNANLGGYFSTTVAIGEIVDEAHQAMADLYNASSAREIVFGQNMTSLTLHFSRCLGKRFSA